MSSCSWTSQIWTKCFGDWRQNHSETDPVCFRHVREDKRFYDNGDDFSSVSRARSSLRCKSSPQGLIHNLCLIWNASISCVKIKDFSLSRREIIECMLDWSFSARVGKRSLTDCVNWNMHQQMIIAGAESGLDRSERPRVVEQSFSQISLSASVSTELRGTDITSSFRNVSSCKTHVGWCQYERKNDRTTNSQYRCSQSAFVIVILWYSVARIVVISCVRYCNQIFPSSRLWLATSVKSALCMED